MSFRLYCSLISNRASFLAPSSFVHRAYSPSATLVCARPRCHRLRYGFLLPQVHAHCHATQKSCTVRPVHFIPQVAPVGGTRRGFASLYPLQASRTMTAIKYCSHSWQRTAAGAFTLFPSSISSVV
jgi:hypothetical protein